MQLIEKTNGLRFGNGKNCWKLWGEVHRDAHFLVTQHKFNIGQARCTMLSTWDWHFNAFSLLLLPEKSLHQPLALKPWAVE